ncbi:MAG: PIN domain-containing protein [Micrococcales bacterium]|nr:PIN domain-containing protein [Micrococcales bacterium]
METYYLDTSAFLRGIIDTEKDHAAVAAFLGGEDRRFLSSELLALEAARARVRLSRCATPPPDLEAVIEEALEQLYLCPLDGEVLASAKAIPQVVRSLDALHIATAEVYADSIDAVLTCDGKVATVLKERGVPVVELGVAR